MVTAALDDSVGYCGADGSWGKVAIEACPKGMAASESRVAVVTTPVSYTHLTLPTIPLV